MEHGVGMMWRSLLPAIGLALLALLSGACEETLEEQDGPNHAPIVNDIRLIPSNPTPSTQVTVYATAIDPDGDELSWSWETNGGEIEAIGRGDSAHWTTPSRGTTVTLSLIVSDGVEEARRTKTVQVTVPGNSPPTVILAGLQPRTLPGDSATLTADAYDEDGDLLSYAWSATRGELSGSAPTAQWIAPEDTGAVSITVSVDDGHYITKKTAVTKVVNKAGFAVLAAEGDSASAVPLADGNTLLMVHRSDELLLQAYSPLGEELGSPVTLATGDHKSRLFPGIDGGALLARGAFLTVFSSEGGLLGELPLALEPLDEISSLTVEGDTLILTVLRYVQQLTHRRTFVQWRSLDGTLGREIVPLRGDETDVSTTLFLRDSREGELLLTGNYSNKQWLLRLNTDGTILQDSLLQQTRIRDACYLEDGSVALLTDGEIDLLDGSNGVIWSVSVPGMAGFFARALALVGAVTSYPRGIQLAFYDYCESSFNTRVYLGRLGNSLVHDLRTTPDGGALVTAYIEDTGLVLVRLDGNLKLADDSILF